MKGRLNLFQAAMLRWRALHPYNAVHVIRIGQPLDPPRLRADITGELERCGLTGFALDAARRRFEYAGGPSRAGLRVVAAGGDARETVLAEIEREINTPFSGDASGEPFRFFAVDSGDAFDLGLAYDHVVAGGESVVALLKAIVDRHCGGCAPQPAPNLYPPTYGPLLRRNVSTILRGLGSLGASARSLSRSVRPRFPHGDDPHNGVAALRVEGRTHERFVATAKAWGVTRNDLVIAVVLAALAPLVGAERHGKRRSEIAVASIVNVRRDLLPDARPAFGQFLSSCRFSHPVPDGIALEELARDVHAETERIKHDKLYLPTLGMVALANLIWPFLSPSRRAVFHAKSYPVWLGVTPLDVRRLWCEAGGTPPREYLRVVPTGPLAPLVVAATTDGGGLALGFSFRTAAFTGEDIDRIAAGVQERIATLCP
jgi:hypothetical protein